MSNASTSLRRYPPCRHGRTFESSLLALSIICFTMSVIYGVQISRAPVNYNTARDYRNRGPYDTRSAPWAIFYYGFLPLVACCVTAVGTFLYATGRGSSLYSLIVAAIFSVGWWVANGFHVQCDWVKSLDAGVGDTCPQSYLKYELTRPGEGVGTSTAVLVIKSLCGILIGIIYLVYLTFAAIAVAQYKKLRKSRSEGISLTRKAGVESSLS
ncbi:hypothetical protein EJ08DRAFT_654335 [Tothia fuscella]|uniref:Uncharacterized protein n=1 Tax=Tothia fuscella TaxID=1048955 RepID=A0A9P4NEZ2_9PEZI|nr:hypothetical protein EJ08DRAFT_654335 [Tothia fuscella]